MNNENDKFDCFANDKCTDGTCPLLVEESIYGWQISDCSDYCGSLEFIGCHYCTYEGSDMCSVCVHYDKEV